MKRFMIMILVCVSMNITSCDNNQKLEQKNWKRQYMPFAQVGNNHRSQSIAMFALSLLCGPAVMIHPVVHPLDFIERSTTEIEEKIASKKIVLEDPFIERNEERKNILNAIVWLSTDIKVESRLLTLQDIGGFKDVNSVQIKLKPHQLKKQNPLKNVGIHSKISKNPSQR